MKVANQNLLVVIHNDNIHMTFQPTKLDNRFKLNQLTLHVYSNLFYNLFISFYYIRIKKYKNM